MTAEDGGGRRILTARWRQILPAKLAITVAAHDCRREGCVSYFRGLFLDEDGGIGTDALLATGEAEFLGGCRLNGDIVLVAAYYRGET